MLKFKWLVEASATLLNSTVCERVDRIVYLVCHKLYMQGLVVSGGAPDWCSECLAFAV